MKQQTAVDCLIEQLTNEGIYVPFGFYEQAKQMEKEQIIKTHIDASSHKFEDVAENYYNKIYSK